MNTFLDSWHDRKEEKQNMIQKWWKHLLPATLLCIILLIHLFIPLLHLFCHAVSPLSLYKYNILNFPLYTLVGMLHFNSTSGSCHFPPNWVVQCCDAYITWQIASVLMLQPCKYPSTNAAFSRGSCCVFTWFVGMSFSTTGHVWMGITTASHLGMSQSVNTTGCGNDLHASSFFIRTPLKLIHWLLFWLLKGLAQLKLGSLKTSLATSQPSI